MDIREFYDKQKKPSKYRNKACVIDGIRFASQKEGDYYLYLKSDKEVHHVLRQTTFHLPGGVRYFLDFMVFKLWTNGLFEVLYIDTKGIDTPVSKLKRKQVEEIYKIRIETP